jgi:hypothetical protein
MTRMKDDFADCAIYLYPTPEDAAAGAAVGGSGFLVGVPPDWAASRQDDPHIHAVTNAHVTRDGAPVPERRAHQFVVLDPPRGCGGGSRPRSGFGINEMVRFKKPEGGCHSIRPLVFAHPPPKLRRDSEGAIPAGIGKSSRGAIRPDIPLDRHVVARRQIIEIRGVAREVRAREKPVDAPVDGYPAIPV